MYCRIFPLRGFKIGAWVISVITVIWSLLFIFICIFQCTPIARAWNPTIPGKCLYLRGIFIGNAVPNIVTDAAILAMPMHQVWKLQARLAQRLTICGIFLLGCLYVVLGFLSYRSRKDLLLTPYPLLASSSQAYTVSSPFYNSIKTTFPVSHFV